MNIGGCIPNIRIRIRFEFVRDNFAIRNIEVASKDGRH